MSGFKGIGVFKKVIDKIFKLEDDSDPKLGGDLDGNEKMISNIPWLQSMNIGANEVLIGQGDMTAEDYGYSGLSFKHPLGGYFNIGTGEVDGEKVLYFSPPSSYGFFAYSRDQRIDKTIAEIDASALKHLVSKEWVLAKLPDPGISKLQDDLNPILGAVLDAALNKITGLADPTLNQDAATKKYVDDNGANLGAVEENILPLSNGAYSLGSAAVKFNATLLNATIDNLNVNNDVRPLVDDGGNLGISSKRWTNIYAKTGDFSGNIITIEPVLDSHAATKKYVDNNGANLGAVEENILPLSNGAYSLGSAAVKFNAVLYNATIDNLNVNNDVRPLVDDGGNLGISSKRWTNIFAKAADFTGNVITIDPTLANHAATKGYVDSKSIDFENVASDIVPDGDNTRSFGSAVRRFLQVYTNKIGRDIANYIDLSGTTFFYWATSHNFRAGGNTIINLVSNALKVYQNILPNSTNSKDIGSDPLRFNTVFAKTGDFTDGATGTFTSNDGKTVTVSKGIITDIV